MTAGYYFGWNRDTDETMPITMLEAMGADGEWNKERHIADDTIGEIRISTVFLVINHAMGVRSPVLFETMIFGGPFDQYCERYSTAAEARKGHARVVQCIKDGIDPEE